MPDDPERIVETRSWLIKAASDLRAAEHLLVARPPLVGVALFHAQQAVEKALKAFLDWHDSPFRKTHDLSELGRQCLKLDGALEDLCREAARLTVFAWLFRYPGESEEPPLGEAREDLALARAVYEAVLIRLPEEVRP
jgi:HEPN domain-containing protein